MHALLQRRWIVSLLIGSCFFALVAGARLGTLLEPLELTAYDWLIRLRASESPSDRVVVVGVSEDDIRRLETWPVPHGVLADVLGKVLALDPVAVGVDIYLDVPVPPGRPALDTLLTRDERVVTVRKFGDAGSTSIAPAPVHAGTDRVGFTDMLLDPDAKVRRGLLFLDSDGNFSLSLALQMAVRYLTPRGLGPAPDPQEPSHMRLGPVTFVPFEGSDGSYRGADAGGYQFIVDYRERPGAFARLSLFDVLDGKMTREQIAGKLVLFGVTADSVKDLFFTPHSGSSGEHQTPGVVVHAHLVSQLLRAAIDGDRPIRSLSESMELLWLLVWTIGGALCALRFRTLWVFATIAGAGVVSITVAAAGAFYANLWIPLVPPLLGWLTATIGTSAYVSSMERVERRNLMSLFSKHVSPQLANAIWEQRDQFLNHHRPHPQRLTATAFFSDIVNFTTISESLDPGVLMDWLNEYMALMSPRINEHDGVILRFIGDAIMAVFGVPVARTTEAAIQRDAINAVHCALVMQEHLKVHNRDLAARNLPLVGMRIGILTGPMVAGTIGSDERLEYNVHGDTVNTAARLEGFEKETFVPDLYETPCRILVGEETANHLGREFDLRKVGAVSLKGKSRPVAVLEVMGFRGELTAELALLYAT